jgi:hypothetical protein
MIHYLIGLGMAVISSLLCQWILKHTYSDYDWVYLEDSDSKEERKDWNKKLTVRRWYILSIWFICGLLSVASLVVPLILAVIVAMNQCNGEWHFKLDSKIARWLNEEL